MVVLILFSLLLAEKVNNDNFIAVKEKPGTYYRFRIKENSLELFMMYWTIHIQCWSLAAMSRLSYSIHNIFN